MLESNSFSLALIMILESWKSGFLNPNEICFNYFKKTCLKINKETFEIMDFKQTKRENTTWSNDQSWKREKVLYQNRLLLAIFKWIALSSALVRLDIKKHLLYSIIATSISVIDLNFLLLPTTFKKEQN